MLKGNVNAGHESEAKNRKRTLSQNDISMLDMFIVLILIYYDYDIVSVDL